MHPLLRCFVAIILAALCAAPCAASPVVGTEVRMYPTYDAAPGSQDSVEIAASTDGYLAVWHDTRGGQSDIFACRLSSTGQVIDQAAFPVCQYTAEQTDPAVAWNGREYLVVWGDRRDGPQHIYGARVRLDGTVIDPQGICLSGPAGSQSYGSQAYPRVASDGSGWEIVWQDSRGGSQDIYGVKLSGAGVLSKVTGIVTLASNNEELPDIAYNGSTFIVVWRDYRNIAATDADIYGCRVATNGIRMAGDTLVSCDSTGVNGVSGLQSAPRICAFGSSCFVVWEDYRGDGTTCDVYGTRLSSTATVTDRNGIAIATGTGSQEMPAVAYDGTKILVAWRDHTSRYVRGARVSTAGSVTDSSGINIYTGSAGSSGIAICPSLTGGFWVGWNSLSITGNHVLTGWVPASGSFTGTPGTTISLAQENMSDYSVADNGSEYAVVWSQDVGGKECILGARVSYAGQLLSVAPVNITASIAGQQTQPSIAWNGSEYLVAWCGDETYLDTNLDIRGLRLNADLSAKDLSPILICTAVEIQASPCVCSNGSTFLVAWEDSRNALAPTYYTDIYGATVSATGAVTAMSSAINMSTGSQLKPRIASDGTNYFVAWEDYRSGYPLIYGTKVTSTGVVSSSTGVPMPATSASQTTPFVVYGGGNYLVTWSDGYRIAGCRVNTSGSVVDISGINIDSATTAKNRPATCWDGTKFQAVWEDYQSQLTGNSDIYLTTLTSAGLVSTEPRSGLVTDLTPQTAPRIFGSATSGVVYYTRVESYINSLCLAPLTQQNTVEVSKISDAKVMPTGTSVTLRGKVVTAVISGGFYAEEVDRSSSVRVISNLTVHVGDIVDVTGIVGTCDGERQITTGTVTAMGIAAGPTRPYAMRGDMLGGAPLGSLASGITGGIGASNMGLLVETWGTVSSLGTGYFYIDCIPGVSVKVKSGSLLQPKVGDIITVVGISTGDVSGGAICRAILPRTQADIRVVKAAP